MAIPNISSTSGSRSASDNGTTGSGGTIEGGGAGASNNKRGPLFAFNPIMELFYELWRNYKGVKMEKLQSLHDF
jgi:hypothetical protein